MNRLLAASASLAVAAALLPAAASATGSIQKGRYDCYVYNAPGVPTSTGRAVRVTSARKYAFFNGAKWTSGRYRHGTGSAITFRTGPLKGKAATHKVYGNGKHGIDVQMTPGFAGKYVCSRA